MLITETSIEDFINSIEEPRKTDIIELVEIAKKITNKEPKMWGSIIGFGSLHYTYESGRSGDMPIFAFANRKNAITLYISFEIEKYHQLKTLAIGFPIGKSCLYIKRLSDIDLNVLKSLITEGIKESLLLPNVTINEE